MIEFQQVSKSFGGQDVLLNATFRINAGERVGIVGPNGAGKSTVFGLIAGEMTPDHGNVTTPRQTRLGYLHQHTDLLQANAGLLAHVENAVPELRRIRDEIAELEQRFHDGQVEQRDRVLARLGELQTALEALGGYELRTRARTALGGLGFSEDSFVQPFNSFSGGWQMRAELARTLVANPGILLLDEPSNYLDVPAVEWLQGFLRDFRGTLLLISHDRYLLNSLTRVTVEIANTEVTRYAGNYDYYAVERQKRSAQRAAARKNQDRKRAQAERFIERFRSKNTKATQVQSKIKALERMDEVELTKAVVSPGRIRLRPPPHSGVETVRLEDAGFTYDGERWVLRHVGLRIERGQKVALVGLNGTGKTTLLRLLAGQLPLAEGRRHLGHKVVVGYQSQEFAETMPVERTVLETVKNAARGATEQEIRTLLGGFGFSGDAIDKSVGVLSGGERVRLAFARLLVHPPNFLILDEPTTHLDIAAREALEGALQDFKGTLCFVSHDIEFVRQVAQSIVAMTPPGVTCYAGGYDYYHAKASELSAAAAVKPPPPKGTKPDRAALRRERARRGQEASEQRRGLRARVTEAERALHALEVEQAGLLEALQPGSPGAGYADVSRRLKEIQVELDLVSEEWEEAATALEALARDLGANKGGDAGGE